MKRKNITIILTALVIISLLFVTTWSALAAPATTPDSTTNTPFGGMQGTGDGNAPAPPTSSNPTPDLESERDNYFRNNPSSNPNSGSNNSGNSSWLNTFLGGGSGGGSYGSGGIGGGSGIVPQSTFGLPTGTPYGIARTVLGWLLALFGILGIIGFVISGIMYLISAGSTGMVEKAKNGMLYSIIGIVVGLSGYIIIYTIDYFLRSY